MVEFPEFNYWVTPSALSAAATFAVSIVATIIGIQYIAAPRTIQVLLVLSAVAGFGAWYSAAGQAKDSAEQTKIAAASIIKQTTLMDQQRTLLETQGHALKKIAAAVGVPEEVPPEQLAVKVEQDEQKRRDDMHQRLRQEYMLSHDGIPSKMIAGQMWPPDDWMNSEIVKQGGSWQVHSRGADLETFFGALSSVRVDCSAFWRSGSRWNVMKDTVVSAGIRDPGAGKLALPKGAAFGVREFRPQGVDLVEVLHRKCE